MIIPDIDYLQDVCLSKSQQKLLLEKLETSLNTLKHILRRRNEAIVYNRRSFEKEPTPRYIGSRSYDYHIRIRNLIAVVRLYKKLVDVNATVIKWLELYT